MGKNMQYDLDRCTGFYLIGGTLEGCAVNYLSSWNYKMAALAGIIGVPFLIKAYLSEKSLSKKINQLEQEVQKSAPKVEE